MRVTFFFVNCEIDNPCAKKVRTNITRKKLIALIKQPLTIY